MKESGMMSRQQSLLQLSLLGTILLGLLAGVYLFAWKRFSKSDSSATVVKHPANTSSDDALKYWTADKMRRAKPVPMPKVKASDLKKQPPRRPPHSSRPHQA